MCRLVASIMLLCFGATVGWRKVLPAITGVRAPRNDAPHFVDAGTPGHTMPLRVFLPGTHSRPSDYTHLLDSVARDGAPTIGLSYDFIPIPDAGRNRACYEQYASSSDKTAVARCLANQHADCLWGGNSEPMLWSQIHKEGSIAGRMFLLIAYLIRTFPTEGWHRFIGKEETLEWSQIVVGGFSQGASHTAFLAQTFHIAGAVLLSGPQDQDLSCPSDCPDTKLWLDREWATQRIAAAHHTIESAASVINQNYQRMAHAVQWQSGKPVQLKHSDFREVNMANPPVNPVVSKEQPSRMDICGGRAYHCSMALDSATPLIDLDDKDDEYEIKPQNTTEHMAQKLEALYGISLWPALYQSVLGTTRRASETQEASMDTPAKQQRRTIVLV